jgi:hypothetical protein
MKVETLSKLFGAVLLDMKEELKSYSRLFCLEHGYVIEDFNLFLKGATLLPEIRVTLEPALGYERKDLALCKAQIEDELNNIVFAYAYNNQHRIHAEEQQTIERVTFVSQNVRQLMTAQQN